MNIENIVKTTVFLSDMSLFDGMNQVYAKQLKESFPAISKFDAKTLPKNSLVEIEVIAAK